jgi:hypothetical protein
MKLLELTNKEKSPIHIVFEVDPAFITKETLILDRYFGNIVD